MQLFWTNHLRATGHPWDHLPPDTSERVPP